MSGSDERGADNDAGQERGNLIILPVAAEPERPGPPPELLVPAVEACLFAMPGVISLAQLQAALKVEEDELRAALAALEDRLIRTGAGVRLVQVGDGWQLRTEARLATWVAAIRGGRTARLSRAALETLAIIGFRQPVTKAVIDEIRGVDCGGVLKMLIERGLVRMLGRGDEPGRPLSYGTTPAFLHLFGMRSLADLPTLRDLRLSEKGLDGDEDTAARADGLRLIPPEDPG